MPPKAILIPVDLCKVTKMRMCYQLRIAPVNLRIEYCHHLGQNNLNIAGYKNTYLAFNKLADLTVATHYDIKTLKKENKPCKKTLAGFYKKWALPTWQDINLFRKG